MANVGTMAHKRVKMQEEEAKRIEANREELDKKAHADGDITMRTLPRGVNPEEDSLDPLVNKKLGEQDLPVHLKSDGRTNGIRHDQMEGVQSAFENNGLDPEEQLEVNLNDPVNLGVREVQLANAPHGLGPDDDIPVTPRTREEMEAGKKAIGNDGFGDTATSTNDRGQQTSNSKVSGELKEPAKGPNAEKRNAGR